MTSLNSDESIGSVSTGSGTCKNDSPQTVTSGLGLMPACYMAYSGTHPTQWDWKAAEVVLAKRLRLTHYTHDSDAQLTLITTGTHALWAAK